MHNVGDIVELDILDQAQEQACFGRLDSGISMLVDGKICPGDRVKAKVYKTTKNLLFGNCIEIIKPAAHRIEPPCPHFNECPGCKWQMLPYEIESSLKSKRLSDAIERVAQIKDYNLMPFIAAENEFEYRNKIELTFKKTDNLSLLGYNSTINGKPRIVDIQGCAIAHPLINQAITLFKECLENYALGTEGRISFRLSYQNSELAVNLKSSDAFANIFIRDLKELPIANITVNGEFRDGQDSLNSHVNGITYNYAPSSFFQVNTEQAGKLSTLVQNELKKLDADKVIDLYCGCGFFTLAAAKVCGEILGIEGHRASVESAEKNAKANNITNATFMSANLKKQVIRLIHQDFKHPDVIIVDPPRMGLSDIAIKDINTLKPRAILYISCDPGTLARDLKKLNSSYSLQDVHPLDMFPKTPHLESLSILMKK